VTSGDHLQDLLPGQLGKRLADQLLDDEGLVVPHRVESHSLEMILHHTECVFYGLVLR
jgi:hypothetical protein